MYASGINAVTAAIGYALTKAGMPYRAQYVPPEDETVDGEIEFWNGTEKSPITVQIGPYGGALNRNEYRDGELVSVTMLKSFDIIRTAEVCDAVVAEMKAGK